MQSAWSRRVNRWTVGAVVSVPALAGGVTPAGIVSTGDVKPAFNLPGSPPGSGVTFTTPGGVFVGDAAPGTLTIENDSTLNGPFVVVGNQPTAGNVGTLDVFNGSALNLADGLDVGWEAAGVMRVIRSSVEAEFIRLGARGAGSGIVNFQAADVATAFIDVGAAGGGQLVVEGDSVVRVTAGVGGSTAPPGVRLGEQSASLGTALITGPFTEFHVEGGSMEVGENGRGRLTVSNGAEVNVGRILYSAFSSSSTGTLEFTGTGTTVTSFNQTAIADGGTSDLTISAAATLDSRKGPSLTFSSGIVGFRPGSDGDVTITGAGSRWVNDGTLNVGFQGDGTLDVESGGRAESVDGVIARLSGSTGTVNVTGTNSRWNITQGLYVGGRPATGAAGDAGQRGPGGTGLLTVGPGGAVNAGASATVFADGTIDVSSGGSVIVGLGATPAGAAGTVVVRPGATLAGSGRIIGNVLNGGGTVAPGQSPGRLRVTGRYDQTDAGTLDLEIGGLLPAVQHDQLAVTGAVSLDGTLAIRTDPTFTPAGGQSFTVMTFASRSGRFDTVTGRQISAHRVYAPVYSNTDLRLVVTEPGDATLDGVVNLADFGRLRQNFGDPAAGGDWTRGDFNVDGAVNLADFGLLRQHFGHSTTSGLSAGVTEADWAELLAFEATVPEPAAAGTLLALAPAMLARRRRPRYE